MTPHFLKTTDNVNIALWETQPKTQPSQQYIFLTHGAFSTHKICLGIAEFLANMGYRCFILEWRNHGASEKIKHDFDFETVALYDIKTAFDYLYNNLNIKQLHCITHSGGGICLTMFLIRYPHYKTHIKSMTLVACQAFALINHRLDFMPLYLAKTLTKIIGFIPARLFKLGTENESYATMSLWFDWNLTGRFLSRDKSLNYREKMSDIDIPILSICAFGDKKIAPVRACQVFLQSFENTKNRLAIFGVDYGHLENYSHGRILLSRHASQEVWQEIVSWIEQHGG